jgi:hypothetical protein
MKALLERIRKELGGKSSFKIDLLIEQETKLAVQLLNALRDKKINPSTYLWEQQYNKGIDDCIDEIIKWRSNDGTTNTIQEDKGTRESGILRY